MGDLSNAVDTMNLNKAEYSSQPVSFVPRERVPFNEGKMPFQGNAHTGSPNSESLMAVKIPS